MKEINSKDKLQSNCSASLQTRAPRSCGFFCHVLLSMQGDRSPQPLNHNHPYRPRRRRHQSYTASLPSASLKQVTARVYNSIKNRCTHLLRETNRQQMRIPAGLPRGKLYTKGMATCLFSSALQSTKFTYPLYGAGGGAVSGGDTAWRIVGRAMKVVRIRSSEEVVQEGLNRARNAD